MQEDAAKYAFRKHGNDTRRKGGEYNARRDKRRLKFRKGAKEGMMISGTRHESMLILVLFLLLVVVLLYFS